MANKLRECMIVWEEVPGDGKWNVLAFDGVVKEGHSGSVQVTSYPVDSGFMVSDHAIRQNRIIELDTITSNISMSVATSRKTFEESFNELMVAVGSMQLSRGAPVYEAGQVFDPAEEAESTGPTYRDATKYGRAKYDNESIDITIPYTSITLGTLTNPFATALLAQVSMEKVDEVANTIDRLNALGMIVHLITMRGVRKNCVIRSYGLSNDVSNAYSLPASLTLEQMNIVDLTRSTVQTSTNYSNGEEVATEQSSVRSITQGGNTYINEVSRRAPQAVSAIMPFAGVVYTEVNEQLSDKKAPTDIVPATFYELKHREIPYSTGFDTRFIYNGIEYSLGKVWYNVVMEKWVTSLQWRNTHGTQKVASIPLTSGTNLVRQYATNLPSLVAVNIAQRNADPTGPDDLRLYIIEGFDETFLRSR